MIKLVSLNYKLITLLLLSLVWSSLARAGQLPDFTLLVEKASPAVVNISTSRVATKSPARNQLEMPRQEQLPDIFKYFFERQFPQQKPPQKGQAPKALSSGSGFLISVDGYILTNHHVVKGADKIIVALSDRREMEAELICSDPRSDLALLKIDGKDLPYLKMADPRAFLPMFLYIGLIGYALIDFFQILMGKTKKNIVSFAILFYMGTLFLVSNTVSYTHLTLPTTSTL